MAGAGRAWVDRQRSPAAKPDNGLPVPLGPRAALQQAWLARAATRSASALPILLERLRLGPSTDLCERLRTLLGFAVDARIADAAVGLLAAPPVKPTPENPLFLLLGLLVCAHGDTRHAAALTELGRVLPSLAWLARLTRFSAPLPVSAPTQPSESWFLAAIARAPEDLQVRALFADWLSERGDPRGEFIALQLLEAPTAAQVRRAVALERKHGKTWVPTLRPCFKPIGGVTFEKGCVASATLFVGDLVPSPEDPVLATLVSLKLVAETADPVKVRALLGSPFLTRLRHFDGSLQHLSELHPQAREHLVSFATTWQDEDSTSLTLPALEHAAVERLNPALLSQPLFAHVKHLRVAPGNDLGRWLEAARGTRLQTLSLEYDGVRFSFESLDPPRLRIRRLVGGFWSKDRTQYDDAELPADVVTRCLLPALGTLPPAVAKTTVVDLTLSASARRSVASLLK
jgi:uncharacterized protein (TIGR02996 family)